MGKEAVNWQHLETEYITADPAVSQQELAVKYGVSRNTIAKHCVSAEWVAKRKEHQVDVAAGVCAKIGEQQVVWRIESIEMVDELLSYLRKEILRLVADGKIADVEKLMRLKAFLLGEPDARQEVNVDAKYEITDIEQAAVLEGLIGIGAIRRGGEAEPDAEVE